jgi:hypothetical protein
MPSSPTLARPALDRPLRWLAAVALAVSAYLHWDLARSPYYADGQITLSGLFLAQAVVAALVAVWVALRGETLALLAALAVAAGSLVALVLSVYVRVPSIGPFPVLYEPLWYGEKVAAAVAAAVASVAALAALALRRPVR